MNRNNSDTTNELDKLNKRIYLTFNYPGAVPGSKTLLTGIRGSSSNGSNGSNDSNGRNDSNNNNSSTLYITGFYEPPPGPTGLTGTKASKGPKGPTGITGPKGPKGPTGEKGPTNSTISFFYKGDITGRTGPCSDNSWNILNYPSAPNRTVKATNLYGPQILNCGAVRAVGNYTTVETGSRTIGCLYEGLLDNAKANSKADRRRWISLNPTEDTINTIAHSVDGNLVVGNYDTILTRTGAPSLSKAFIYDIRSQAYHEIVKPNSRSVTAYGIWHNTNENSLYTICGGFSNKGDLPDVGTAYLVDWDNRKKQLSNWREYRYKHSVEAIETHFNGITSDGRGGYNLTGDAVTLSDGPIAFSFNSTEDLWEQIQYPGGVNGVNKSESTITSGNSIHKSTIIGVYLVEGDPTINGYISPIV